MHFSRLALLLVLLICCLAGRGSSLAQSTNVLSLCTEQALRARLEIGGSFFVQCRTSIVSIALTEPLVFTRNITLTTTNEILLNGQNLTRIMVIQPGVQVTLEGFTFFNGRQSETNLSNGGIDATAGGAIYNDRGTFTLRRARFEANSAIGITGTAGDDGSGDHGDAGGDAAGGAIYNNGGFVAVSNVIFSANSTTGGVGGKGGNGRSSGFGADGGNGGAGGSAAGSAIYSQGGSVFIYASVFTNNLAAGAAGGVAGTPSGALGFPGLPGEAGDGLGAAVTGDAANIRVLASTFVANIVEGADGADGNVGFGRNDGDPGFTGGDAAGGAIYSTGNLSVTNSTFFGNSAVSGAGGSGGAGSAGGFGFDGGDGGNGGFAVGGAIESQGPATIVHSTFADNVLTAGLGGAGGAGSGLGESGNAGAKGSVRGGSVYGSGSVVQIANSIFANSFPTIDGNILDRGGNIATDRNALIKPGSFKLTEPGLLPLANNGGLTPTMALITNSFAIDRANSNYCVLIDQRGATRTNRCDIGAYEFIAPLQPIPPQVLTNGLAIFNRSNLVTFRWPAGYSNLFLQGTTALNGSNTVWTTITNATITTTNGFNFFSLPPNLNLPFEFYRLNGLSGSTNTSGTENNVPLPPLPPFPPFPSSAPTPDDSAGADGAPDDPALPPLPPMPSSSSTNTNTSNNTSSPPSAPLTPGEGTGTGDGVVPPPPVPQ